MGIIYSSATEVTLADSAAETSLFPSTVTIPSGLFTVGMSIRIDMRGVYSTAVVIPTIRYKLKLGATTVSDSSAVTSPTGTAFAHLFELNVFVTVKAVGAGGSVVCHGRVLASTDSGVVSLVELIASSAIVIDTTADRVLDITAQWGTASILNVLLIQQVCVEIIAPTS